MTHLAFVQYAEARPSDFGLWDRVKLFFLPRHYEEGSHGWSYRYYKVYKARKVIVREGRYK